METTQVNRSARNRIDRTVPMVSRLEAFMRDPFRGAALPLGCPDNSTFVV
jgi:hypothetical protein